MTIVKWSLVAALIAACTTGGGLFWHRRDQMREVGRLRSENARLQQEIETRVHAAEAAAHRNRAQPNASAAAAPSTQPVNEVENAEPAKLEADYRNEGNATPQATLQTFAWACDQGDVETVMRLIHFDEAARVRAQAFMAELPEDARRRWPTPEAMAATMLVDSGMRSPYPHARVLDTISIEQISAGRVKLRLSGIRRADSEYQLTPDGWKYAVTVENVEAYIAQRKNQ